MPMQVNADFSAIIKRMQGQVTELARKKIIGYAVTLHQNLVASTPVLTGQAASNWQLTLGEPATNLIGGSPARPPAHFDVEGYAAAAEAEVQFWQPGEAIFITNNAPWIVSLNQGSSRKAPAGFVEAAVHAAQATLGN